MQEQGFKNPIANLQELGLKNWKTAYWNLSPEEWGSMIEFAGYRNVKLDKRGVGTVFYCEV